MDRCTEQTELLGLGNSYLDYDGDYGVGGGVFLRTHQTIHVKQVILFNENHTSIRLT